MILLKQHNGLTCHFLCDADSVAERDGSWLNHFGPHACLASMRPVQRLVDGHIAIQPWLRAIDHRAANAASAWEQSCRSDVELTVCPIVLDPSLAAMFDQNIRTKATYVPRAVR